MSSGISPSAAASPPVNAFARLLPLTLAVFVSFLCLGMPMPVLPLHLSQTLGLGTLGVGTVMGCQFAAALLSRAWAGSLADTRGARQAVVLGMALAAVSGLAYLMSRAFEEGRPQSGCWPPAACCWAAPRA